MVRALRVLIRHETDEEDSGYWDDGSPGPYGAEDFLECLYDSQNQSLRRNLKISFIFSGSFDPQIRWIRWILPLLTLLWLAPPLPRNC